MKRITSLITVLFVLFTFIPTTVFAVDDNNSSTLQILAIASGSNAAFNDQFMASMNPNELSDEVFDYSFAGIKGVGSGVDVIAVPKSQDAQVKIFATVRRHPGFSSTVNTFTGEVTALPTMKEYIDGKKYIWYQPKFQGNYKAVTLRIEVRKNDQINNYNIICSYLKNGVLPDEDKLAAIKTGFGFAVDSQTDASAFISSAKAIIETAKPIYKARMEAATDPMEACKIANEFNIIVCQAKAIEDEYMILNDKVTDAEDALSGISTVVKNSAIKAADAAEALDLTEYSEEDAAAITEALDELKGELADETATPESILEKKSALDDAVNTAKLNAVKASEEATQIELDKAKEDLDKVAEENGALKEKIAELTQAKEDAEAKLDDTEKKLDETKEKLAKAEKALIDDAAGKVVASAEKYIDAAKADLEKAAQAIAENAGAFAEDTAKKFFAKAAEAIKAATKGLEQVNGTLAEGNNRIEDLKSQLKELSETIKSGVATEAEVASLNKQLEEAKDELEQAKADLAKNEGISSELEQLKAELEKANAELAKATKPEQVTANSAKAGKKKVTVKWTALDGAEGYVVYRSLKKNKGFKAVKTIKKAKTVKFTDKKVKKGKKYFYKVRAYKMYDGNKLFGAYSKVLKTAKVK